MTILLKEMERTQISYIAHDLAVHSSILLCKTAKQQVCFQTRDLGYLKDEDPTFSTQEGRK